MPCCCLSDGEYGLAGDASFGEGLDGLGQPGPGLDEPEDRVEPPGGGAGGPDRQVGTGRLGGGVGQVADQPGALVAEEVVDVDRGLVLVAGADHYGAARR